MENGGETMEHVEQWFASIAYVSSAGELIERAARFRSAGDDPSRHLSDCPALVLNADYTPLSYYPLSLWPWQEAIKAAFLDLARQRKTGAVRR